MSRLGDGLSLLLIALLADAVLGGIPGLRELLGAPLAFVRAVAGGLERRLNRERRGPRTRMVRGILVALFLAVAGWLAGIGAAWLVDAAGQGRGGEALVLLFLVGQRRPFDLARRVAAALGKGDRAAAATALIPLAGQSTAPGDDHALARTAIEAESSSFAGGVVGLALWYLALGLPGACLYRTVNEAARRIGPATPPTVPFGAATARLDALLSLIPGPVAGFLLALAALFVPGARPAKGFAVMGSDFAKLPAPTGWTTGAMAGALGLALGGPQQAGMPAPRGWIGDGRARAGAADVRSATWLFAVAALIHAGALAAARLALAAG